MLGTFMEVLDTTVVNVSLQHIAGSLSVTPEEATWVLTSYLVANAIVLPLTGWLGNYFGRRNILYQYLDYFQNNYKWLGIEKVDFDKQFIIEIIIHRGFYFYKWLLTVINAVSKKILLNGFFFTIFYQN